MDGKVIHASTVEPLMNSHLRNQPEVGVREGWLVGRGLLDSIHFSEFI